MLRQGDGVEVVLAEFPSAISDDWKPYRIAAGWVAFVKPAGGGLVQFWLRTPDGNLRAVSTPVAGIDIQGLTETGEVIFDVADVTPPGTFGRERLLARTDGSVIPLDEVLGKAVEIDGAWYAVAGPHLLLMDPDVPSRSILSEGATGTFFTTDVAILNPHDSAVPVTIRYLRENAPEIEETRTLPALSRTTIHENDIPGLEGDERLHASSTRRPRRRSSSNG